MLKIVCMPCLPYAYTVDGTSIQRTLWDYSNCPLDGGVLNSEVYSKIISNIYSNIFRVYSMSLAVQSITNDNNL